MIEYSLKDDDRTPTTVDWSDADWPEMAAEAESFKGFLRYKGEMQSPLADDYVFSFAQVLGDTPVVVMVKAAKSTIISPSIGRLQGGTAEQLKRSLSKSRHHEFAEPHHTVFKLPFCDPEMDDYTFAGCLSSAFAEREVRQLNRDKIVSIIARIDCTQAVSERKKIAARLTTLFEARAAEEIEDRPMAVGSLLCFERFLTQFPGIKYPALSLSPNGTLLAEWRRQSGAKCLLHFLADQYVIALFVLPEVDLPFQFFRTTATVSVRSIGQHIARMNASSLIIDEKEGS